MITTIYLLRHSIPFKEHRGTKNTNETILIENEKTPLSIAGEKLAEEKSLQEEFKNLDIVYSSNYVRAMATAKYFASVNNLKVNIDEVFNERIHGVDNWGDLPQEFELKQFNDENFKVGYGESQKEVQNRMFNGLMKVLNENKGKRVAIISHSTAIAFLLKKWCEVYYDKEYIFNNKAFFNGKWEHLQSFKLEFKDNELISIKVV